MTITEFIEARLADAQDRAEKMDHFTVHEQPYYSCPASRTAEEAGDLEWGDEYCDCHLAERRARALREVEFKRAILAWWQRGDRDPAPSPTYEEWRKSLSAYQLLLHLAAIWRDHPDYEQSWAPNPT